MNEGPSQTQFSEVIDVDSRTADVTTDGSFKSLLLSQSTLDRLNQHAFKKPSPVQLKAIPPGLAGFDMLVQAKSGTGKTLVFSILAVENLIVQSCTVQKLIVAPTREIASQICETIEKLIPKGVRTAVLTGGISINEQREKLKRGVHIVVGTSGRLCQMAADGHLSLNSVSLFVLDEADKMMTEAFEKDVNYLYSCLPQSRQVTVFSATYPPQLASALSLFLRSAVHVRLNSEDVQLLGIKQFVSLSFGSSSIQATLRVLSCVQFKQAIVFCLRAEECPEVSSALNEGGIDSAAISAKMTQREREDVILRLKKANIKVLVSTDLTARGIDAENIDLVINLDPPYEAETYFHRIGRAARFGGQGASVTLLCDKRSVGRFCQLVEEGGIKAKLTTNREFYDACEPFELRGKRSRKDVNDEEDVGGEQENTDPLENVDVDDKKDSVAYSTLLDEAISLSKCVQSVPVKDSEIVQIEKPKKFKFVPSRAKKSTKFYMRGELMGIRESKTREEWKTYAEQKFDLSEEPFTVNVKLAKKDGKKPKASFSKDVAGKSKDSMARGGNGIKEYTRKDMMAIVKSKGGKVWREYALSKWNLEEEPFVKEYWMRCSYTEQLRLQRAKEKKERDEVIASRKAQRIRLLSLGTIPPTVSIREDSFDDYCTRIQKELDESKGEVRRGPCVSRRSTPEEYRQRVTKAREMLGNFDRRFAYVLSKALGNVKEEEGMTKEEKREGRSREEEIGEGEEGYGEEEEYYEDEEEYDEEEGDYQGEEEYYEEENEGEGGTVDYGNASASPLERFERAYSFNTHFATVYNAYLSSVASFD